MQDGVAVQFEKIAKMPSYPKISNVITQTHPGDNMVSLTIFGVVEMILQAPQKEQCDKRTAQKTAYK